MKDIVKIIIESIKNNKKKIKKVFLITVALAAVGSGLAGGALYRYVKSNINYSEKQLEEIALKTIPGEVVNIKKEFEFEDAAIEYTFEIKDDKNILQEITVSSKTGAITDIEINGHDSDDYERYDD